ncbi:hypothetical protein EHM82_05985, partial [bacterium]
MRAASSPARGGFPPATVDDGPATRESGRAPPSPGRRTGRGTGGCRACSGKEAPCGPAGGGPARRPELPGPMRCRMRRRSLGPLTANDIRAAPVAHALRRQSSFRGAPQVRGRPGLLRSCSSLVGPRPEPARRLHAMTPSDHPFRRELAAATRLAAPVALVQLGMMLMGVVDAMMLGRVSAAALASGALGHIVSIALIMFGSGVLAALDPLIAQAHGAGDHRAVAAHFQRGVVMAGMLTLPFALALWDVRGFLELLGQPAEAIGDAAAYARAIIPGILAYLLF